MPKGTELNRLDRIVAALLAAAWIGAGLVVIGLGVASRRWLILVPALLGLWYGLLWARVSVEGRRLTWPAGLWPWTRKPR